MNEAGVKQQIVEKIKSNSNILVTVSSSPSVDELSAALGLTLLLNKMKKHATAVFSGKIPPAISFLDPEKTFESTVDSLRDFIIALDKEKADHLRYKVEGDVVKIFITPYRTTLSSDDLDFSQGDYNVELVLALGVNNQEHLDEALSAHGRILHDATVATIGCGSEKSNLGNIDWCEEYASSLSEMVVTLSDSLKADKALLDDQIATAFLTGIVAATDRFSNKRTSSKVMTVAAQLMAAGANQQLIASKLEESNEIGNSGADNNDADDTSDSENSDGTTNLSEGESTKLSRKQKAQKKAEEAASPESGAKESNENDGSLHVSHEKSGDLEAVAKQTASEKQNEAASAAEQKLAEQLQAVAPAAPNVTPSVAELQKDLADANADVEEASEQPPAAQTLSGAVSVDAWKNKPEAAPSMGGTLNATTDQAAEDAQKEQAKDQNRKILTHDSGSYIGDSTPTYDSPINATNQEEEPQENVDPMMQAPRKEVNIAELPPIQPNATLADLDKQNRNTEKPHNEARAAVEAAYQPTQETAASQPTTAAPIDLPPLPPLPDFSTLPPDSMLPPIETAGPQLPPENLETVLPPAPEVSKPPAPADPGQFKIPGQS